MEKTPEHSDAEDTMDIADSPGAEGRKRKRKRAGAPRIAGLRKYTEGEWHGLSVEVTRDGTLRRIRCYDHGLPHGPWITADPDTDSITDFQVFVRGERYPLWMEWGAKEELCTKRLRVDPPLPGGPPTYRGVALPTPATLGGEWLQVRIMHNTARTPSVTACYLPGFDPHWASPCGPSFQQYVEAFIGHHLNDADLTVAEVRRAGVSPDDRFRLSEHTYPPKERVHAHAYCVWFHRTLGPEYETVRLGGMPAGTFGVGFTDPQAHSGGIPQRAILNRDRPCVRVVDPRNKRVFQIPFEPRKVAEMLPSDMLGVALSSVSALDVRCGPLTAASVDGFTRTLIATTYPTDLPPDMFSPAELARLRTHPAHSDAHKAYSSPGPISELLRARFEPDEDPCPPPPALVPPPDGCIRVTEPYAQEDAAQREGGEDEEAGEDESGDAEVRGRVDIPPGCAVTVTWRRRN